MITIQPTNKTMVKPPKFKDIFKPTDLRKKP